MERRDFLKMAALGAMALALAQGERMVKWLTSPLSVIAKNLATEVRRVPVKKFDPKNVKKMLLKLEYTGNLPKELQVHILSKKKTKKLAEGQIIELADPVYANKVYKMDSERFAVILTVSPEAVTSDYVYAEIWHIGEGFRLTNCHIEPDDSSEPVLVNKQIEGYTSKISYAPGDVLELKVHTLQPVFSVDFIRHGAKEETIHRIFNIPGQRQKYSAYAYRNGANWKTSLSFRIPSNWKTGLYSAKLTDGSGKEFYAPFVLKGMDDRIPKHKRIAVLASTNTWAAYNTWGGASLYQYHRDEDIKPKFAQMVSLDRPYIEATPMGEPNHLANAEKLLLAWMEQNGYPYTLISDWDLHHNPEILFSFGTLIINTHGEYWTQTMYDALEKFMEQGGNLMTLSGNAVYWKTVIKGNHMEVRKAFDRHLLTGEPGGQWRNLGRPESAILGVAYTRSGYGTFHPYQVKNANHWVFKGTGLKKGDLFGEKGINRGGPGASGLETDKRNQFTPSNAVLLAKGTNPQGGGAEMVYYDHPGGGGVFSVGSVSFTSSLIVDEKLGKVVKNVIERFTSEKA
jgi:hypothetical protein